MSPRRRAALLAGQAVLTLVAAAAVSGCARAPAERDTLTIAQQWEPRSLNPALENGTSSTEWSMLIFSYLVKYDDRGRLIPDVATEVPTTRNGGISTDGKTIIYHIRRGIRFADGTPLTAADCAWSIGASTIPITTFKAVLLTTTSIAPTPRTRRRSCCTSNARFRR